MRPGVTKARVAVGIALLIGGGLAGVALNTGPPPVDYRSGGREVLRPGDLLAEADRDFLRAAHREDASLHPDARCYLSLPGAGPEVGRHLRCGPVRHFGARAGPWDTVPVRAVPVPGGARLERDEDVRQGQALGVGEQLSRPDRAPPPQRAELPPPGPPRVGPGEVIVVSAAPAGVDLRRVGTTLSGPGEGEVEVVEVGVAEALRLPDGPRRPASGEEFVVARTLARLPPGTSLELVAGRRRGPVPEAERLRSSGFVITSVAPGTEVMLEVTYRGVSQRVSLRDGEADDGSPLAAGLPVAELDRAVDRQEAPVALGGTTMTVAHAPFRLNRARLVAHNDWLGTAPPGQGWLSVSVTGLSAPSVPGADGVALDLASSFVAVLPDGRTIGATELGPSEGGDRTVFLAVPEAVRNVVVRVAPTYQVAAGDQTATLAYPAVEVPVTFQR